MSIPLLGAGPSGAGAAFTPLDIAGLYAWFQPSTLGANGSAISSWTDSSGNARHATQATGTSQPTVATNAVNGLSVARFDGGDVLNLPSFAQPASYTLFAVGKSTAGAGSQALMDADQAGATRQFQFRFNGGNSVELIAFDTVPNAYTDSQAATVANFSYITGRRDGTTVQAWVNGTSGGSTAAAGTAATDTLAPAIGGGSGSSGGKFLTGDIAEVLYYDSALSAANRQSVESYLALKYAL